MSTRRASSDRPRGWSLESGSSQDDVIVYRRTGIVKEPDRQPRVPPSEDRAQQDEGFARFLKKHSSPTHQRVTARGRIVPMEQRQRPPVFSLEQSQEAIEPVNDDEQGAGIKGDHQGPNAHPGGQPMTRAELVDDHILQPQPQAQNFANAGVIDAGLNVSPIAPSDAYPVGVAGQPGYLPLGMPSYYGPAYHDPYTMNPQMVAGNAVALASPLAGFNSPVAATFPMSLVPSPEMFGLPDAGEMPMSPMVARLPDSSYDRHMLINHLSHFDDLERQLKSLDRHRAMNTRDPYVTEHRMAIVQLRSETKIAITYWATRLGLDPKALPKDLTTGMGNSNLNVQAAAYVPRTTAPSQEQVPTHFGGMLKTNDGGKQTEKPRLNFKGGRHAIPIVPPPGKSPSPKKDGKDSAASQAGSVEVDEWGVRVGPRPLEIARQQDEMLEQLVREASISPHGSSDNAVVVATPEQSSLSFSPFEKSVDYCVAEGVEVQSESAEWLPTNPGRAPPTVEACYELQLDAMRLPNGLISKIRLPDGTITEVRGRGLQRPPSFEMDEFEKRYWTTKPVVTKDMTRKFVEVRFCGGDALSEQLAEYLDPNQLSLNSNNNGTQQKEDAKEGLSSRGTESSSGSNGVSKWLTSAGDLGRGFGRNAYNPTAGPSTGSDPSMSTFKQSAASSPHFWSREDMAGWHSRNGRDMSFEAVNTKGFSSVSVQNVHAIGRLPHMMDGTAENHRRSAKSMLSAAGKTLSPPPMQSPVSPPPAAYGPYRRDARGVPVEADDVFRPRMGKEEEM